MVVLDPCLSLVELDEVGETSGLTLTWTLGPSWADGSSCQLSIAETGNTDSLSLNAAIPSSVRTPREPNSTSDGSIEKRRAALCAGSP